MNLLAFKQCNDAGNSKMKITIQINPQIEILNLNTYSFFCHFC